MPARIQPPPDLEASLAKQWAYLVSRTAQAKQRPEEEHGVACCLIFATAIYIAYGFDTLGETNAYLIEISKKHGGA